MSTFAIYSGKVVSMDYIADSAKHFKLACMRVSDNAGYGWVVTDKREVFEITANRRTAKKITGGSANHVLTMIPE